MRNLEEFNNKYKNKLCFILGAGCSLAFEDLSLLKDSITIGVNSGYSALPDASFFISDDWSVKNWSYVFEDLKKSDKTIALLYDKKLQGISGWFGNRSVIFRHKKGYELSEPYSHSDPKLHIWEARTSVGSAIHVAYIMGCNPICLLGVDCCRYNGFRYFWQMDGYKKPYRNDRIPIDAFKRTSMKGIESDVDLDSIKCYWDQVYKKLSIKNTRIYNISQLSVLDVFPKTTIREVLDG